MIVLQRLAQMLFVLFGISVLVFLIFFATPGADPAARIAGRNATPEVLAAVRHDFGFDRPMPVQYALMMKRLFVTQDLTSFVNRGQLVIPEIVAGAPVTLSLVVGAAVLWVLGGLAIGVTAAVTRGGVTDRVLMVAGLVGVSMPVFWVGQMANLLTQSRMHDSWLFSWVPPLGYTPLSEDPVLWFKTLLIPWATLALLVYGAVWARAAGQPDRGISGGFVRTARAKGLSETRILLHHALRTSLITFVSLFGLDFGALVGGGALLTEVVFSLQGVGKLTFDALQNLDLPVIMACVMYASFFVVAANAAVDVAYVLLDPRVS